MAVLPTVGAGRVQAEQGNAAAGFLDVEPMRLPKEVEMQIAPDYGFETRAHAASFRTPAAATTPLK